MNKGTLYAVIAYCLWGFFPIYFKALHAVPAFQIMTHRVVWSFIFLFIFIVVLKEINTLLASITPRVLLIYLVASILVALNWLIYVWGVNAGYVVECSLGYFINPLVSVLLGMIILGEKLRRLQWIPVALAFGGVLYLTVSFGSLPWIALALAFSFGLYGLVKKIAPLPSLQGLTLETGIIFLPALAYLFLQESNGVGAFGHISAATTLLLVLTGIVTAIPLLLFATSAHLVPLSTLGLIQYIAPTLQFLIGVLIFRESFTQARVIGFCIIWIALIIFSAESLFVNRKHTHPALKQP
jgi:chloramphenicol-sensitive protein RarD